MSCTHCQKAARFEGYRPKTFVSLIGELHLSRPYYSCPHCHDGSLPWDEMLRLSAQRLTPGAQEVATLAGIQESFGKAASCTLQKLAGIHICESTVQRTTEAAGGQLGKLHDEGKVLGPARVWKWHRDSEGKLCAYVSVDATGILMQGANGAKVEGRMVSVGMIFNPQPRQPDDTALAKPCTEVRYLAGLYSLEELGLQLRRQAAHVGMDEAEQWIALTDGGNGLEHFMDVNFPRAVTILDFQHAAGYLADLAKLARPGSAGEEMLTAWCHAMKHRGGTAILQVLEGLDRASLSAAAQEQYDTTTNYIRNNVHRMDYPAYLRRGWQIATGAVESACKTVVNQRLSMGGMRWGEAGSDNVAHLRALYRSEPDQWDAFWQQAA